MALRFIVSDPDSQPVDVAVQFKRGTMAWTNATPADESDGLTRLPAPFLSANYRFIWNTLAAYSGTVALRIVITRGGQQEIKETAAFAVNTNSPPPPAPFSPKVPVNVLSVIRTSGDNQVAIRSRESVSYESEHPAGCPGGASVTGTFTVPVLTSSAVSTPIDVATVRSRCV